MERMAECIRSIYSRVRKSSSKEKKSPLNVKVKKSN